MFRAPRSTLLALFRKPASVGILLLAALGSRASGQSGVWTTNGPPGGTVVSLVPDPSSPQALYAGTSRGVFRTDDGGATWVPANGGLPADTVDAVAADPGQPGTLYAGTLTPAGVASDGIFKSTDRGVTWTAVNGGLVDPVTLVAPLDVEALAVDPSHPGTILAGTRFSEIFKSTDGGATWEPKTFGGFNVGLEVSAFAFDPSNASRIYAASTQGLILSTDGGENWQNFGDAGISFFTVAVDPGSPMTLYAGNAFGFGVLKSTDGGAHWLASSSGLPTDPSGTAGSNFPIVLDVAVDPQTPTTVYAATQGNGVFRSTDAGATWTSASAGMRDLLVDAIAFAPSPGTRLYAGTRGGGIYASDDGAASWTPTSSGIFLGVISGVAADPAVPGRAFASAFDGVYRTDDGGQSWQPSNGGLPAAPVATILLVPGATEKLFAGTLGAGLAISADGGSSWTTNPSGLTDPYIGSVTVDPSDASIVYAGTARPDTVSDRVFKSTDGGASWTQTSLDAKSSTINALAVNPGDPMHVVAISRGASSYFESLDGGGTWSSVSPDSSCGGVNAALFSGTGIALGTTAGVCRSTDGGKTWTLSVVASLASIRTLMPDPSNPATLYAGAAPVVPGGSGGVFRSQDGGGTWTLLGAGLSDATVTSLALDASGKTLHAGVSGGSVAELSLGAPDRLVVRPIVRHRSTRVIER